jgi:SAM-dependent methyltransferase
VANAWQARRWNGDAGRRWIAQRERHVALRQRLTPHLLRAATISPGDRVLDVGCGCGEPTIEAARATGPDGGVVGLDLSAPMLAVARRLAAEAGVGNVRFVQGDAQACPLAPAVFDVVISSFGVMFFDDPATAFANILSRLRPGGRLAFLCWQGELCNEVFGDVRVVAVHEPARIGSEVADVMGYVRNTSRVRELTAELDDQALASRVFATMAAEFAARRIPGGVWVDAAAWLVTAAAR